MQAEASEPPKASLNRWTHATPISPLLLFPPRLHLCALAGPATIVRSSGSFLTPRYRQCPMLATGSTGTAHRTSWPPSEASSPEWGSQVFPGPCGQFQFCA